MSKRKAFRSETGNKKNKAKIVETERKRTMAELLAVKRVPRETFKMALKSIQEKTDPDFTYTRLYKALRGLDNSLTWKRKVKADAIRVWGEELKTWEQEAEDRKAGGTANKRKAEKWEEEEEEAPRKRRA